MAPNSRRQSGVFLMGHLFQPMFDSKRSILNISSELIAQLKTLPPIPQKTHVTWPNKNVINSKKDMVKYGLRNLVDLNPGWTNTIWIDYDIDNFLQTHLSNGDWNLIKDNGYAEKSDIWRLILMYCEGGYYQDMDRLYNIPLATIIEPETRMLLPMNEADFSQDMMATSPGNPIFKRAIELNLQRRRATSSEHGINHVMDLGPQTYFDAVAEVMFGLTSKRANQNFLIRSWNRIQQISPLIKTKRESWCHLIVA